MDHWLSKKRQLTEARVVEPGVEDRIQRDYGGARVVGEGRGMLIDFRNITRHRGQMLRPAANRPLLVGE